MHWRFTEARMQTQDRTSWQAYVVGRSVETMRFGKKRPGAEAPGKVEARKQRAKPGLGRTKGRR
jgi:hypothetical protein